MAQAQDGSGIDPTDAEAWDCLVQNSHCLENRAPNKVRDSITEIIRRTWGIQGHDINTHDLALVWLDPRSKVLATRLVEVGPGRDVFDIDMIHRMKLYRLGGYWDTLIDDAMDWFQTVFQDARSRVSTQDYLALLRCVHHGTGTGTGSYYRNLKNLFWADGLEPHKASSRASGFLGHLPLNGYSQVYNIAKGNPPDARWNLIEIMKEIRTYGANMKLIMLHVSLWYNPALAEPAPRQLIKDPIYYHLREPFSRLLFRGSHKVTEAEWKAKAVALQKIVLDFSKKFWSMTKGPFMASMLKFYVMPEKFQYQERFVPGAFWDLLAKEILHRMPDMPFQHPDLQAYVVHGQSPLTFKGPSDGLPASDASNVKQAGEMSAEILGLIGREYGPSTQDLPANSRPNKRKAAAIKPDPEDEDALVVLSSAPYKGFQDSDNLNHRPSKIVKLKIAQGTIVVDRRPIQPVANDEVLGSPRSGSRSIDLPKQVRQEKSPTPSRAIQEPSPSTSASSTGVIPSHSDDAVEVRNQRAQPGSDGSEAQNTQPKPLNNPLPPPRRRQMTTNLPLKFINTPPASAQPIRHGATGFPPLGIFTPPNTAMRPRPVHIAPAPQSFHGTPAVNIAPRRPEMQSLLHPHPPPPIPSNPFNPGHAQELPRSQPHPRAPQTSHISPPASTAYMSPAPQTSHISPPAPTAYMSPAPQTSHISPPGPQTSHISPPAPTAYMSPAPQDTPPLSRPSPAPTPPRTDSTAPPQQPQPPPPCLTRIEQSIQILEREYSDRLSLSEQVKAMNALQDERKAAMFCIVRREELRRAWLWNEIGKGE